MADETKNNDQELSALAKRMDALEKSNDKLVKENGTLRKQVDTLTKSASSLEISTEPEKLETPKDTFKVEDQEYRFVLPAFMWEGKRLTAVDALADETILAHLVDIDSGLIQEVK